MENNFRIATVECNKTNLFRKETFEEDQEDQESKKNNKIRKISKVSGATNISDVVFCRFVQKCCYIDISALDTFPSRYRTPLPMCGEPRMPCTSRFPRSYSPSFSQNRWWLDTQPLLSLVRERIWRCRPAERWHQVGLRWCQERSQCRVLRDKGQYCEGNEEGL